MAHLTDQRGPVVSVIVPTCRRLRQLRRALRSVQRQTFQDWDCWVVNDYPPDGPALDAMIAELTDDRFGLISSSQPPGASASRNAGLERSRGRIVAFLDDDDVWLTEKLAWHVQEHQSHAPCVVYSDVVLAWEDQVLPPVRGARNSPPADAFGGLRSGRFMTPTLSAVSVDRECLAPAVWFDPELNSMEDLDFLLKLASRYPIRHVEEHAVIYFQHPMARLSTDSQLRLAGLARLVERWRVPESAHRLWIRDRACLHAMIVAATTNGLSTRLRELRRYSEIARPPGRRPLPWALRGVAHDPRGFARLCALALFGLTLHDIWHRLRGIDLATRNLVSRHLELLENAGGDGSMPPSGFGPHRVPPAA